MFLDIVGVITTSKLNILSTFQAPGAPPPCQVGLKNVNLVPFLHIWKVSLDLLELTFVSISFYEENS